MKRKWPIAHIEMYSDGRTHLSFENETVEKMSVSAVQKTVEAIKNGVVDGLGEKLQPGRAYRIKIKKLSFFRGGSIEFDYDRIR